MPPERLRVLLGCTIAVAAPGCAQLFGLESPGLRDDAPPGGDDAGPFCYGRFAPSGVCFAHEPAGEVALAAAVSTDDAAACSQDVVMDAGACVIAAQTLRVPAVTRVRGTRPLVLVGVQLVQITGTLDAAGRLADGPGAGAVASCAFAGSLSKQDGGAGGSDQALGGDGGVGGGGSDSGVAVAVAAPTSVRGGCPGQTGGADIGVTATGLGGGGGGAVWLIGSTIQIMGAIDASGAGGKGAQTMEQGGGGGGAGGMIVLDAATLDVGAASTTFADGGGGGAGASAGAAGGDGAESVGTAAAAGGTGPAGPGGAGAHGATLAGARGGDSGAGAGAGGGAAGWIFAGAAVAPATFSPAPTPF